MKEYEISVSQITIFVPGESREDAMSNAETWLQDYVWDYGSMEVV